MAEDKVDIESLLSRAKKQEKEFDWLGAAKHNLAALELLSSDDATKAAEVQEAVAYDFYRAAFQSEDVGQFRKGLEKASEQYEKAMDCYSRINSQDAAACANRCGAMNALSGFWFADESSQKKSALEKAWNLAKESFKGFHSSGNSVQYGMTYNLLAIAPGYLEAYGNEPRYREKVVQEALTCGERVIGPLKEMQQDAVLAGVYTKVSYFLQAWIDDFVDPEEEDKYAHRASEYFSKARELSGDTALADYHAIGVLRNYPEDIPAEEDCILAKKGLDHIESTKDHYLIGKALEVLALTGYQYQLPLTQNPEDRESVAGKALAILTESQRRFAAIDFISPCLVGVTSAEPHGSHYFRLAMEEPDLGRKKDFAMRWLERMPDYLRSAEKSGFPDNILCVDYLQGSMLTEVSRTEDDLGAKKELLQRAVSHLSNLEDSDRRLHPRNYWFRGVDMGRLARAEGDLAGMIEEPAEREMMLKKALQKRIEGLELMVKATARPATQNQFTYLRIGESYYDLGSLCHEVFLQTDEKEYLRRTIEAIDSSVKWYRKGDTPSRVAEVCWRLARLHDESNEYLKAAENYSLSAEQYKSAADKLPSIREFYTDHCNYLQAWSQIEKAKLHHAKQEFAHSKECFEKAAQLHGATRRWTYLASNYSAWANTERAEELSRRQEHSEAIKSFQEAVREFQTSQKELESQAPKIEDDEGRQLVKRIASVSTIRQDYCRARIVLEEARLLDENSEDSAAADKFGQAAEMFERIGSSLDSDEEKREFRLMSMTAKAWQAMARAEAESSPGLYAEAARLFEAGKELCSGDKATAILLGHSRFCMALEAGMKFADTGESSLHSTASKNLESAAKFYLKAGLEGPSEYAKASKLLFDGYEYMNEANMEKESEKKARLFMTAEKVFEASAVAYSKAGHPGKREQIEKLMEKVRDERQLAMSLTDLLRAPAVMTNSTGFSSPTPAFERATGLERFEHADVQAALIVGKRDIRVGEDINIEIELVNAGRGAAQLTKLENVIPSGFDVVQRPENYRIEDSYIIMKGKRLDSLKTEEIALILKPNVQGRFILKPRILYLDEEGSYKVRDSEGCEVTVKELGVAGWLKGPEKKK